MSDSRSRSPDTIDIEIDPASRNVRQRLSPIPGDPYLAGPSNPIERADSNEEQFEDDEPIEDDEPMEDEEPFEDGEASFSTIHRTPSPLPSASPPSAVPSPAPIPPPAPVSPPLPDAPPDPVAPSLVFSTRNHGVELRWDWMPTIIRAWRNGERIPVLPTPDDLHTPTLHITGEPIHCTIPVVVARLRTHDEQLNDVERGVEDVQHQLIEMDGDLAEIRDEVVANHQRGTEDREEIASLRQEVAALRQEMAEMRAERDRARADAASTSR